MFVFVSVLVLCVALVQGQLSPDVNQLVTDFWNWRISDMPEFASSVGIHDYDDRLDQMSLSSFQERYHMCEVFHQRATLLEVNHTGPADLLNLRVLKTEAQTFMDGYPYGGFLTTLCYLDGVHVDFESLITFMKFETLADYNKLISRYQQLPRQLQQIETLMREGVSRGIVNHAISMKGVVDGLSRFVVTAAEKSPLWKPFVNITASDATKEDIEALKNTAQNLIENEISGAFQVLRDYVANEYVTRPEIAISSLPNGEARYAALLKFHTSTTLTAQEIHQKGLQEVARIETLMSEIIANMGFNMTVQEFSDKIRNDPKNFYTNADDMLAGFRHIVFDIVTPRLPALFAKIPKAELQIVSDTDPNGVAASYWSGSYDGSRPGGFHVNTYNLDGLPKYTMMSLSLHEAYPGHHFQISYAIESEDIPFFRRATEGRNYVFSPSKFPINTAYIEGWGLYSESLGFDLDLYEDPLVRYGHYSEEIFRASRMVVDTGMHALGWTKQQAIDFMMQHSANSASDIEHEIDRYITWPGQAVAYKVGELKMQEFKEYAKASLGSAFDIKMFHEILLQAKIPLDLMEDDIKHWVSHGGKRE